MTFIKSFSTAGNVQGIEQQVNAYMEEYNLELVAIQTLFTLTNGKGSTNSYFFQSLVTFKGEKPKREKQSTKTI